MRLGLKTVAWSIQIQDRNGGLSEKNSVNLNTEKMMRAEPGYG